MMRRVIGIDIPRYFASYISSEEMKGGRSISDAIRDIFRVPGFRDGTRADACDGGGIPVLAGNGLSCNMHGVLPSGIPAGDGYTV